MLIDNKPVLIIRLGLGIVFLWFGTDKLLHPEIWIGWIPDWIIWPFSKLSFIYVQGILQTLLGIAFLIGILVRFAAIVAAILMAGVLITVGLNDLGVRDFLIFVVALALITAKNDTFTISNYSSRKR